VTESPDGELPDYFGESVAARYDNDASPEFRYVWPAELDLMARIAGMRLVERWQDWDREPFTNESRKHVSVWQKVEA